MDRATLALVANIERAIARAKGQAPVAMCPGRIRCHLLESDAPMCVADPRSRELVALETIAGHLRKIQQQLDSLLSETKVQVS